MIRPAPDTARPVLVTAMLFVLSCSASAATLEVGPGKRFARIEEANARAQPGDVILVHPRRDGRPYGKTAVYVRQPGLTFRAVPDRGTRRVTISGQGFEYSGVGSTPRAIFQFNPGADHGTLDGFDLAAAHNDSHNGAGVRINQANHVVVRDCAIHDNDMGVMSNGDGSLSTAVDQRIEHCRIYHNGDPAQPGYNHNLYLGGTSVTLRFCEVGFSLTGQNVKSRAHHTRVEYCYIHHSANREFDLVDAAETARPESHAVLVGNIIVKDPQCPGNRAVIHFGQDGGNEHDGALYLAFNTIVTPFISPVVDLSAPKAKAALVGNLVSDGGDRQSNQVLAGARNGAALQGVSGSHNWLSGGFSPASGARMDPATNDFRRAGFPLFVGPAKHDYRLVPQAFRAATTPLSADKIDLPEVPGVPKAEAEPPLVWQYRHPAAKEKRPAQKDLTLGAVALAAPAALGSLALATAQESKEAGGDKHIAVDLGGGVKLKMVLIPVGEFKMGSGESAEDTAAFFNKTYGEDLLRVNRFRDEHPQHRVRITRPFYLGTYHVTRGQFRQFVADSGYKTDAEKGEEPGAYGWDPDEKRKGFGFNEKYSWRNTGFEQTDAHPVVSVSWNDAVAFCKWLSRKEGKTYRLPTEAEWEYACRAGTTTRYYSGDDPETLAKVGNVADATAKARFPDWEHTIRGSDGYVFTAPAGSFKPNAFGLYDMHGNAWQWCSDWFGKGYKEYYATSPANDPTGPGSGWGRVVRGGAWLDWWHGPATSAERVACGADYKFVDTGFRVARTQ
jgi:formylglycine-generating enzyme required for sulfatase activity